MSIKLEHPCEYKRTNPKLEYVKAEKDKSIKRQRNPVKLFQSPSDHDARASRSLVTKEEVEILYKKGSFLALRGDDGSFFLCRCTQNVTSSRVRQFCLLWLSPTSKLSSVYHLDYADRATKASILTNVSLERVARDRFKLPLTEKAAINRVLNRTLKFVAGDPVGQDSIDEEKDDHIINGHYDSTEESTEEPPSKRRKVDRNSRNQTTLKRINLKVVEKQKGITKQKANDKNKGSGHSPGGKMRPNMKIKILERDPFFESRENGPFVSVPVHTKYMFAAVNSGDVERVRQLINSNQVYGLDIRRSPGVPENALDWALKRPEKGIINMLVSDIFDRKVKSDRLKVGPPVVPMSSMDTGLHNPTYLRIKGSGSLKFTNSDLEGNNAFNKDADNLWRGRDYYICNALKMGIKPEMLDHLTAALVNATDDTMKYVMDDCIQNVHMAIENGHQELAAKIVSESVRVGNFGYNYLHEEVLAFNEEDLRPNISAIAVKKRPFDRMAITPMHCAAINPNPKYLARLLAVVPNINLMDRRNRRPIHYAAACCGSEPLRLLLSKHASITDVDSNGDLPLHRACTSGRAHNVALLLKHAEMMIECDQWSKWGVGGINQGNRQSYCPIHLAVINQHVDVLRVLLDKKVSVDRVVSASKKRMTALMMAAERGYLDMARQFVHAGAVVELLDGLKRSALTHAVLNGNSNVASYLLYLGANPDRRDSSGNSLVHYAAAYGWYDCLKLLVDEAGAAYNEENDWKTTPLAIAFWKGHTGIVDYLLKLPDTDVNAKSDIGMTLVSMAVSCRLVEGLDQHIDYLVNHKKADPTIFDKDGFNALHHLCANNIKLKDSCVCDKAVSTSVRVADILFRAGCDVNQVTGRGRTPVILAMQQANTALVHLLIQHGSKIPTAKDAEGKNQLHKMAEECMEGPYADLIHVMVGQVNNVDASGDSMQSSHSGGDGRNGDKQMNGGGDGSGGFVLSVEQQHSLKCSLKAMATSIDNYGYTPLLRACKVYTSYQFPASVKDGEVETKQRNCRDFIQALIDVACSNIDTPVMTPGKLHSNDDNSTTAIHMMVRCQTERPVKGGDTETAFPGLALILRYKPDLEAQIGDTDTPLAMAVHSRNLQKIKMLMEAGANPNVLFASHCETRHHTTPCHFLLWHRELSMVKELLLRGADPTVTHPISNFTLLHHLAECHGNMEKEAVEMMTDLLHRGLDINSRTKYGKTALHIALESNSGDKDDNMIIEEFLLDKNADIFAKTDCGDTILHSVFNGRCASDPIDLLFLLTTCLTNQLVDVANHSGNTPLHLAASMGATVCCLHLLQKNVSINIKNCDGNTPLALAVKNRKDSCAIMLLEHGADVENEVVLCNLHPPTEDTVNVKSVDTSRKNVKPGLQWRPLRQTSKATEEREACSLFQAAISSDLQGVAHLLFNKLGFSFAVVEAALKVNKLHVALRLLKCAADSSDISSANNYKQNLLHILAAKSKPGTQKDLQLQVAKVLLGKGVSVCALDVEGCSPVHYCAIFHQPVPLARLLIEQSPNFYANAKDIRGRDLISAVFWDYEWVSSCHGEAMLWSDLLLEKGLSLDTLFDRQLPDILLFGANLDRPCPGYFTSGAPERVSPLILAIRHNNLWLARYLMRKGASPNYKDSMGYTPLIHAVKMNDMTMVRLLLDVEEVCSLPEDIGLGDSRIPLACGQQYKMAVGTGSQSRAEWNADDKDKSACRTDSDDDNGSEHDTDVVRMMIRRMMMEAKLMSFQLDLGSSRSHDIYSVANISNVNIDATDPQGMTAFHHCVFSLNFGSFDNGDLVKLLMSAHGNPLKADMKGELPKDSALMRGAARISEALQSGEAKEIPSLVEFSVVDSWSSMDVEKPNFAEDADAVLSVLDMDEDIDSEVPKVDENFDKRYTGEVYVDEGRNVTYDIMLIKDYAIGASYGVFKFYKLQIVRQKSPERYLLFTVADWVGLVHGHHKFSTFTTAQEAVKKFCEVFWKQTGNDFRHLDRFVEHKDKYRLMSKLEKPRKSVKVEFNFDSPIASNLNSSVQDLLRELPCLFAAPYHRHQAEKAIKTNVSMFQAASELKGFNQKVLPFAFLMRCDLERATDILLCLQALVGKIEPLGKSVKAVSMDDNKESAEQVMKLTRDFLHVLPVIVFQNKCIQPIRDKMVLKEYSRLVEHLKGIVFAYRILLGSQHRLAEVNPLDYIYRSVGCKLQPMGENEHETQIILTYINVSGHDCKVDAVYKVSRPGEEAAMAGLNLGSHRLLWYGTSLENIVSLLARGLLVAPPSAAVFKTGNVFGEGVCFTDCFRKCCEYCRNPAGLCQVAVLCEVALGNSLEDFSHDEEDHHGDDVNSLKVLGKMMPDPDFDVVLPYGTVVPLGQLKPMQYTAKSPPSEHSKYIIHDPRQICIRYIVMFNG